MDVPWSAKVYDSGVPVQTRWDRLVQTAQPLLVLLFGAMTLLTTHPLGLTGGGLIRLILCVACMALMLTVRIPDRYVSPRRRMGIATLAGICAGALIGLVGQGWAGTFSYMVAVHSGVRFTARIAIQIVTVCVFTGVVTILFWGPHDYAWWTVLIVYAALVPGMTRRTRLLTLESAHQVVVQTRRAAASEAESRALAERAAIARDIHDVLAHSLSGVNMQLSLADALFESGQDGPARDAVRTAQKLVVSGLTEARAAVQTLRGDTVDPVDALGQLATGPNESFELVGEPAPLPSRRVHALVRIAQEAVTNARRHAPGAPLHLALDYSDEATVFTARNGQGEQAEAYEGSGLGLIGMRERAASVDAVLHTGPLPADDPDLPSGWLVRLELPYLREQP